MTYWTNRIEASPNQDVSRNSTAQFFYKSAEYSDNLAMDLGDEFCGPAGSLDPAGTAKAFRNSGFQTRVARAVAATSPCNPPIA